MSVGPKVAAVDIGAGECTWAKKANEEKRKEIAKTKSAKKKHKKTTISHGVYSPLVAVEDLHGVPVRLLLTSTKIVAIRLGWNEVTRIRLLLKKAIRLISRTRRMLLAKKVKVTLNVMRRRSVSLSDEFRAKLEGRPIHAKWEAGRLDKDDTWYKAFSMASAKQTERPFPNAGKGRLGKKIKETLRLLKLKFG